MSFNPGISAGIFASIMMPHILSTTSDLIGQCQSTSSNQNSSGFQQTSQTIISVARFYSQGNSAQGNQIFQTLPQSIQTILIQRVWERCGAPSNTSAQQIFNSGRLLSHYPE